MSAELWFLVHCLIACPLRATGQRWAEKFHLWTGVRAFVADVQSHRRQGPLADFAGSAVLVGLVALLALGAVHAFELLRAGVGR